MLPGIPELVKCPSCGFAQKQETLMSGNTFGALHFSDGSRIAPMLPETPRYTKCPECSVLFGVCDAKREKVAKCWGEIHAGKGKGEDAPYIEFLSKDEYCQAINEGLYGVSDTDMKGRMLDLRLLLWRAYNRRIHTDAYKALLDGKKSSLWNRIGSDDEEVIYRDNCRELLKLLEGSSDDEAYLIKAEIYRNLGDFDRCREALLRISKPKYYRPFIDAIKTACDTECTLTVPVDV